MVLWIMWHRVRTLHNSILYILSTRNKIITYQFNDRARIDAVERPTHYNYICTTIEGQRVGPNDTQSGKKWKWLLIISSLMLQYTNFGKKVLVFIKSVWSYCYSTKFNLFTKYSIHPICYSISKYFRLSQWYCSSFSYNRNFAWIPNMDLNSE